mmetsp:Transcript_11378/g.19736  ORF Transcript_11378/g.19736 Transcript_11378/m.19736 type:complete len:372 (-) Transcript_11378:324-1439(-)
MTAIDELHRRLRHTLTQGAWYLFKLPFVCAYAGWMTLFLRAANEKDLVKFIENTSLVLITRPVNQDNYEEATDSTRRYYCIDEKKLNIWYRSCYGAKPVCVDEVYIVYSRDGKEEVDGYDNASFHCFLVDGNHIMCPGMQLSILEILGYTVTHPASHMFSNDLIFHLIETHNVGKETDLTPSTHTTLELHRGLIASSTSPLFICPFGVVFPGAISATPHSLLMATQRTNDSGMLARIGHHPHTIGSIRSPFVQFLLKSRRVFAKCMKTHGIASELLEPLWLHTVVHSVDHYQFFKLGMFQHSSLPEALERASSWQIFICNSWRVMFERPHLNPLTDNRIKNIHMPFYKDLYIGLAKLDLELADQVTASVMY